MKRLTLLGPLAAMYVLAAWLTVPGFFDGFAPPAPYHWVSPPPDFRSSNQPAQAGQATVRIEGGVAQAGQAFTADGQAGITFPTRSFEAASGASSVSVQVMPVASYPDLGGIAAASNVYLVSASTRLISPVQVTLRVVSLRQDAPSQVFTAETSAGPWKPIGPVDGSVPLPLKASSSSLGYFVAGYPPTAASSPSPAAGGAGADWTPLVLAAGAALIVVLAGIPLVLARRQAADTQPEDGEARPRPARNLGGPKRGTRPRRRPRRRR